MFKRGMLLYQVYLYFILFLYKLFCFNYSYIPEFLFGIRKLMAMIDLVFSIYDVLFFRWKNRYVQVPG